MGTRRHRWADCRDSYCGGPARWQPGKAHLITPEAVARPATVAPEGRAVDRRLLKAGCKIARSRRLSRDARSPYSEGRLVRPAEAQPAKVSLQLIVAIPERRCLRGIWRKAEPLTSRFPKGRPVPARKPRPGRRFLKGSCRAGQCSQSRYILIDRCHMKAPLLLPGPYKRVHLAAGRDLAPPPGLGAPHAGLTRSCPSLPAILERRARGLDRVPVTALFHSPAWGASCHRASPPRLHPPDGRTRFSVHGECRLAVPSRGIRACHIWEYYHPALQPHSPSPSLMKTSVSTRPCSPPSHCRLCTSSGLPSSPGVSFHA